MIYTYVATAILSAVLAFGGAWCVQDWRYGSKEADRLEAAAEQKRMNEKAADVAASGHETDKAKTRVQFKTIYQEVDRVVEKPVYRNVCLDDDGLRLIQAAIGAQPAASQPAPTLPGLKPPARWFGWGRASVGAGND